MQVDFRALAIGASAGLILAGPAAVLVEVTDDPEGLLAVGLVMLIILGLFLAGFIAASKRRDLPMSHGALGALLLYVTIRAAGIVRHALAGDDISWDGFPAWALVSTIIGMIGGAVANRASEQASRAEN